MSGPLPAGGGGPPGYRYRTPHVAPIPLRFKERPEDFVVDEIPERPPSGSGEHLWIRIEKRGLATIDAARRVARALLREPSEVGFAGRKDRFAVTRQWISVRGADPDAARGLGWPDLRVLEVLRDERALRRGQLAGNRFELFLRGVPRGARGRLEEVLTELASGGMANYFGAQRFGRRGRTAELGRALLAGDHLSYLRLMLAGEGAASEELLARIEGGSWSVRRAAGELVGKLDAERAAIARQLVRRPKDLAWLVRAVSPRTRRFQLSALQARVFNHILSERMARGGLEQWWPGDLVRESGGRGYRTVETFRATVGATESATGLLPGLRVPLAGGKAGEIERSQSEAEGLSPEAFAGLAGPLRTPGTRRALRVEVGELEWAFEEEGVRLSFRLPPGSYATSLVEELAKERAQRRDFPPGGPGGDQAGAPPGR